MGCTTLRQIALSSNFVYTDTVKPKDSTIEPISFILSPFAENNDTGMAKRTVGRLVKKAADKAGISKPVSPHVLRHTFSVNYIKKGISTRALQYP